MSESVETIPRRWRRRGRIFPAEGRRLPAWLSGYAALPYPVPCGDGHRVRVYFSGRDSENRSSIGAVTVDLRTLAVEEGSLTEEPLLRPGSLGAFDDSGVTVSCIVSHRERLHLYYTGWILGRTVPFYFAVGLAVSEDGGRSFERWSPAPVLDRHATDPYLCASPSILVEGGRWRMWYVSGKLWEQRPEGPRHHYLVRSAKSADGIHWHRDGGVALDFAGPQEYAIGRPHVVRHCGEYHMWFCSRGDRYRLGRARSPDGDRWTRDEDTVTLEPTPAGWDGDMQAYPAVLRQEGRWWLFYNGNGYGASGFGIAEGIPGGGGEDRG
ncbi:MAG TPA: hypothetical protein VNB06_07830 [Thermoanaerobaculia bacterium]|nr:hypothetical protein [Thermoanaerobaculia bacterium]